jgi:flagellar biogenesis protein FliO
VTPRRTSTLAAFLFLAQQAAWGQAASPSPSPIGSHNSDGMLQLFVYFVLVVALLGAGLYFTRSGFSNLLRRGKGDRKLVISEARTLGNRQFLVVAEYENRKMLLGVCPGRIDYLSTLSASSDDTFAIPEKPE